MHKVILDTDIGSDIDDAVCLAYLLAHPKCDLLGITTVTGQAVERASIASAICRVAGREVPIYPGIEPALLVKSRQVDARQASALKDWPHETSFPDGQAIEFLRRTIRQHPGEVTLLAIGPLTNIGVLFAQDPEIATLLKELVIMGGSFTNNRWAEWNIINDPHAAEIVYRAPVKVHRSIGLDVTTQVQLPADEVRKRFTTRLLKPVLSFAEVWFEHARTLTFHDPLAAATLFEPEICGFESGTVEVELKSDRLLGLTHWTRGGDAPRHQVAITVDRQRYLDHFLQVTADR